MAKFSIGSTVKYSGINNALKLHFSTGMKVIDVIPDGAPTGNGKISAYGEVNNSGQNLYRLRAPSGIIFNFLEDELSLVDSQ